MMRTSPTNNELEKLDSSNETVLLQLTKVMLDKFKKNKSNKTVMLVMLLLAKTEEHKVVAEVVAEVAAKAAKAKQEVLKMAKAAKAKQEVFKMAKVKEKQLQGKKRSQQHQLTLNVPRMSSNTLRR